MRVAMLNFMKSGNCMPEMRHIFQVKGSQKTTGKDLADEIKQKLKMCVDAYC